MQNQLNVGKFSSPMYPMGIVDGFEKPFGFTSQGGFSLGSSRGRRETHDARCRIPGLALERKATPMWDFGGMR